MKEKLEMLLDELQYLKKQGVSSVYCEDASLSALKDAVKKSINGFEAPIVSMAEPVTIPPASTKRLNPFSPLPESTKVEKPVMTKAVVLPPPPPPSSRRFTTRGQADPMELPSRQGP